MNVASGESHQSVFKSCIRNRAWRFRCCENLETDRYVQLAVGIICLKEANALVLWHREMAIM